MYNFFVDVRDFLYINMGYRYKSIGYWLACFAAVQSYCFGFLLLLFTYILPDWLFLYLARNGTYSSFQQNLNIVAVGIPFMIFAIGFNYICRNAPLPIKDEITPEVFRRKKINTYIFSLTGAVFMFICIAIFIKVNFKSG